MARLCAYVNPLGRIVVADICAGNQAANLSFEIIERPNLKP